MPNKPIDPSQESHADVYEETPADSPVENYLVVRNLQRMPSLYSRGILYIVLLFVAAAVIYSILSKIDVVVESHAVARPVSHMMKILSDRDGYIEKIFEEGIFDNRNNLSLFLKGTNFQVKVWEALLNLPPGGLFSYEYLAGSIGKPKAIRAVASAIGQNPVSYLIPCHRVLRKSGAISGYRWGPARKKAIIAWEAAHADKKTDHSQQPIQ